MKIINLETIACRAAFLGLALASSGSTFWAQEPRDSSEHLRYAVRDLGPLSDGSFSLATGVSRLGLINGSAALPDGAQHAVIWNRKSLVDLSTPGLGGPNSGAFGVNDYGQGAGLAETSSHDPNGEDFCGYGTQLICLPFFSQGDLMSPLPTLGGANGEAGEINSHGEVAGNAENLTRDSTCPTDGPQVLEEEPVLWARGHVRQLDTFSGDPGGWAFGINDGGTVVGASGVCSLINAYTGVYILSRHALLWEGGKMRDLGNLGGTGAYGPGNAALEINNLGQVAGVSDLKGDTSFHAFLWTQEKHIQDLGTPTGDSDSSGLGINDRGDVVGVSLDSSGNPRAFVWRGGEMSDLNTLVDDDSPLYLLFAHGINLFGEIVGFGVDASGDIHAFAAVPDNGNYVDSKTGGEVSNRSEGEKARSREISKRALSEAAQKRLRFGRFGVQFSDSK